MTSGSAEFDARHARLNELVRMFEPDMQVNDIAKYLRGGLEVAGAGAGFVVISDPDGVESILAVGMSETDPSIAPLARAAMAGEELVFPSTHDAGERFATLLDSPRGSLVCLPLVARRTLGALALSYATPRSFSDEDLGFLRTLAAQFAQSMSIAQRFAALQRTATKHALAAQRAKGLSDAARFMTGPDRPLDKILADLVKVACDCVGDGCIIRTATADGRWLEMRAVQHRNPVAEAIVRRTMIQPVPIDFDEIAPILGTGKPVVISNPAPAALLESYPMASEFLHAFPVSSFMHVPLKARGRVFGIVSVARHEGRVFDDADTHFVVDLADRAALSIDKARLREQLQHSERQLRVALDAARLGAWEWDIAAERVSWSPTLEAIHGIAPGAFSGTFDAFQRDIHPDDRERVLAAIGRIVEERVDHHICYRIVRRDGEVRWLEAHGKLILDSKGRPERLIGVCSDVTERTKSEEQLRQTLLALQDSDQRKDQFLSMLAHELRNPLGPMLNATHLLGMASTDTHVAERARQILERQVKHMARLVDDLLDVSRISRGKIELRCEHVDLVALTEEVLADQSEAIRIAGLRCVVETPNEVVPVRADRTRLAQIIANTISNAVKFSDRGTIRVGVMADRARDLAVLSIRDEGIGVEPAVLESMFEPFVQADASLSRARGGLGLGLAVVKGLVGLHGGRVTATSEGHNQGTEIRIELPLDQTVTPVEAVAPAVPHRTAATRVLVFEDNVDAAESLRVILSEAGHQVGVETTGSRALEVIRAFQPDVVLCDLGLPEKDGYTIAAEVRSDKTMSLIRMIAISGYGAQEDQLRSKRAGFDVHLTKPVPPGLVLSEISKSHDETTSG